MSKRQKEQGTEGAKCRRNKVQKEQSTEAMHGRSKNKRSKLHFVLDAEGTIFRRRKIQKEQCTEGVKHKGP